MSQKKIECITKDLLALKKPIHKGTLKDVTKIQQRIGRIKEKHKGFDKLFEVNFASEHGNKLSYKKIAKGRQFASCYVIEHDKIAGSEE